MRRFELIDDKSRKFWEIDVCQAEVTVRFGRLGTAGSTRTKTCSSESAATAEAARLIREKTSKGYAEVAPGVDVAREANTTPDAQASPNAKAPAGLSQVELDAIAELLERAAPEYDGHSSNDYDVPANDGNRSVIAATLEYGNRVLAKSEKQRFGDLLERDGRIFIWDSWLIYYLAHRCRTVLGAPQAHTAFTEAESGVLATLLDDLARDDCNFFEREPGGEDFSLAATEEHKEFLMSAVRHVAGADLNAALRALKTADDIVSAYAVDVLRWLAVRCRAAAGHPPRLTSAPAAAGVTDTANASKAASYAEWLGILKGWISEKTLMKRATEMDWSWLPAYAKNDIDLETYASGGNPFREYEKPDVPCRPPFADKVRGMLQDEHQKRERGVILSLFGNGPDVEWQAEYDRYAAYDFWRLGTVIQADGHVDFGDLVEVLANCVYLGYEQHARHLTQLLHQSLFRGDVRMDCPLPLYQWWLRICFEFFQLDFKPAELQAYTQRDNLHARGDCFGEPVLNELVEHWRDPDLTAMSPQLIWLCDYYTHRTRDANSPEPKTEFGSSWIPARLPIVILAWFRLREWLGLTNPDIGHPLMKARYARLCPPRPFFSENVLERVISRLRREELPTLGDFAHPEILEPKRWLIHSNRADGKNYDSIQLDRHWAPGFKLWCDLPGGCLDRSLPETLKLLEPDTGTEFWFDAYRNPGISVPEWAQIALANFARLAPAAERVAARNLVPSWNWTGMAEEFRGIAGASPEPRHYLVAAGKSYSTLLVVHIVAREPVFAAQAAFYRFLLEWKFGMGEPEVSATVPAPCQDLPSFEKIAPDASWMDAEKQFEIGLHHYRGTSTNEGAQIAASDRTLAAVWFERAAEQDHGKAQFNLAMLLRDGNGVTRDLPAALKWAKRAQLKGVGKASQLIAELETLARKAKPFWKIW